MGDFGDNNWLTGLLIHALDPVVIYENMTYFSGTLALAPWLIVVFLAVRVFQETTDLVSGKAALAKALGDVNKLVMLFLAYLSGGFIIFVFLFALGDLAKSFGSEQLVHSLMLELRTVLTADADANKDWIQNVLEVVADVTNLPMAGAVWVIYQLVSVAYIAISRLIDVLFAIGVVLTYAWGFIAIPTLMLKDSYNLTPGFAKTILALGIWLILEPILVFTVWLLMIGGAEFLARYYGGTAIGTLSVMMWYIFAVVAMTMVLLMKIIAPFLALYLSRNDAMIGALGAAPAAFGAIVANQVVSLMKENAVSRAAGDMTPTAGGDRTRDQFAGALNAPISELFSGKDANNLGGTVPGTPPVPDGSPGAGDPSSPSGSATVETEGSPAGDPNHSGSGEAQTPGDGGNNDSSSDTASDSQSNTTSGADISSAPAEPAPASNPTGETIEGEAVRNDLSGADTASDTGSSAGEGDSGSRTNGGGS